MADRFEPHELVVRLVANGAKVSSLGPVEDDLAQVLVGMMSEPAP